MDRGVGIEKNGIIIKGKTTRRRLRFYNFIHECAPHTDLGINSERATKHVYATDSR